MKKGTLVDILMPQLLSLLNCKAVWIGIGLQHLEQPDQTFDRVLCCAFVMLVTLLTTSTASLWRSSTSKMRAHFCMNIQREQDV